MSALVVLALAGFRSRGAGAELSARCDRGGSGVVNVGAGRLWGCSHIAWDGRWLYVSSLLSMATSQSVSCPGCCFWEVRGQSAGIKGWV